MGNIKVHISFHRKARFRWMNCKMFQFGNNGVMRNFVLTSHDSRVYSVISPSLADRPSCLETAKYCNRLWTTFGTRNLPWSDCRPWLPNRCRSGSARSHAPWWPSRPIRRTDAEPKQSRIDTAHQPCNKKKRFVTQQNLKCPSRRSTYLFLGMLNQYSGRSLFLP